MHNHAMCIQLVNCYLDVANYETAECGIYLNLNSFFSPNKTSKISCIACKWFYIHVCVFHGSMLYRMQAIDVNQYCTVSREGVIFVAIPELEF